MKKLLTLSLFLSLPLMFMAQTVSLRWELGDIDNLGLYVTEGTTLLTGSYAQGQYIDKVAALEKSGAAEGYEAVDYSPAFATFTPTTKVTTATAGHDVTFTVTPATGHSMTVTRISFDCVKVGTDGGNIDVTAVCKGRQMTLSPVNIARNKIAEGNSTGFAHNEYTIENMVADDQGLEITFFLYNINGTDNSSPKALGLRNITVEGVMDEEIVEPVTLTKPLNRGLMALHLSSGNLVSWRARKADSRNYKFLLWKGTSAESQTDMVNSGNFIMGKTNFLDTSGKAGNYYRLEVIDDNGQVVETEVSGPTWSDQTKYITLQGGAPTDPTTAKATYTPNDASYCDMDGDGEYEIILKWSPSNEKDAASSGTTSPAFYSCYKLDGTRLWMMHTGPNMFNSAHTSQFIAWDLDGDGYGEFMVKTAPGAIDGLGNYVIMDNDDPKKNWKNSNGKQTSGPEYITVFDGRTGAELKTIKYHTAYADESTSFWGDSKQNRSERYLAAIAWLDGEDANPSAIFARGYYSGCKVGAYDWDGENLTLRWLHRGESATKGTVTYADGTVKNITKTVYGEGAHWICVGDVDGDGKQEIHYGSGALKPDGTTLYRTGYGHGDAMHMSDFIPSRPGLELFMVHEKDPYGSDLRDAKTGAKIFRVTASGDTGRGIMAHFNPESEDAYWQHSASAGLFDTSQKTILESVSHGGGASYNNRIYWNGTLADDFYDKSILEYWNPTEKSFWRMQVNGGNYVIGNENNGSKRNPCVLGDLLGDWREEIVTWTQNGSDFQLIINATNYQTNYTLPHLMDDYQYRAQVVNQNCCYNQPPHLSFDPRTDKTITPATMEIEPRTEAAKALGRYWGTLFTTYAVRIPQDVKAWAVTTPSSDGSDTLKLTNLASGKIIPANRAILFCAQTATPKFVPTALSSNTTISTLYLKGFYCDSLVQDANDYNFAYELRDGERGLGFYRTHGESVIAGGTGYATFGTISAPGAESYVLGKLYNNLWKTAAVKGDVNGDGVVNVADIAAIIDVMAGVASPSGEDWREAADVNGDGVVNVADIGAVIDIMAGVVLSRP